MTYNVFGGTLNPTLLYYSNWLDGSVTERRSLTGELSLVCSAPDLQLMGNHLYAWLNRPL